MRSPPFVFELESEWNDVDGAERDDERLLRAAKAATVNLEVGAQPASE
jgi:hypothetical protein